MAKGDHLGEFEHLVMLALLRLKQDSYGMRVRREIETRTGRSVTIGAVYATLDRLERKGFVRASAAGAEARARKCFRVTPSGAEAIRANREAVARMTHGLSVERELGQI
jgi:PadR family transcriptional regulator PadR